MPKIVDHDLRREEIAQVACRVVAAHGFEKATVARIARAAGYTTGMVAHYYDSKQDIILAALRLNLRRIEQRLTRRSADDEVLLDVLSESLALDARRFTEGAFWMAFWGQVSADRKLRRLNTWVHHEYMRLFNRCLAEHWSDWTRLPRPVRGQVVRSVVALINGLTASAVTSPADWPPARQMEQLRLQLDLLRGWAKRRATAPRTGA